MPEPSPVNRALIAPPAGWAAVKRACCSPLADAGQPSTGESIRAVTRHAARSPNAQPVASSLGRVGQLHVVAPPARRSARPGSACPEPPHASAPRAEIRAPRVTCVQSSPPDTSPPGRGPISGRVSQRLAEIALGDVRRSAVYDRAAIARSHSMGSRVSTSGMPSSRSTSITVCRRTIETVRMWAIAGGHARRGDRVRRRVRVGQRTTVVDERLVSGHRGLPPPFTNVLGNAADGSV